VIDQRDLSTGAKVAIVVGFVASAAALMVGEIVAGIVIAAKVLG
jgi:hypothetical protein